jgi:metal-responsive CopG/Arc/MetJ family transcriptional regulator
MAMKKVMLALPEEMLKALEKDRKHRYLETILETVRVILSNYLKEKVND